MNLDISATGAADVKRWNVLPRGHACHLGCDAYRCCCCSCGIPARLRRWQLMMSSCWGILFFFCIGDLRNDVAEMRWFWIENEINKNCLIKLVKVMRQVLEFTRIAQGSGEERLRWRRLRRRMNVWMDCMRIRRGATTVKAFDASNVCECVLNRRIG